MTIKLLAHLEKYTGFSSQVQFSPRFSGHSCFLLKSAGLVDLDFPPVRLARPHLGTYSQNPRVFPFRHLPFPCISRMEF